MIPHTVQRTDHQGKNRKGYSASVWKEQMLLNLECRHHRECADLWGTREEALRYWEQSGRQKQRYNSILKQIPIIPGMKILDIGGGPGTLAIPLAKKGAEVTVVEPATGMISVLKDNIREHDLKNIDYIQKRFEDIRIEDLPRNYDLVIACFSLGMPDIADCISKMSALSQGSVFLVWFAGITAWERVLIDLWPKIHDTPYNQGPKAELLYHVLDEMEINPSMNTWTEWYEERYPDMDALLSDFSGRIQPEREEQSEIIEQYLKKSVRKDRQGILWGGPNCIQTFQWNTRKIY